MMALPPFQALLDDHGRAVHRFLRARVGAHDADDVYQETCLAALRAYPDLRDAANLRGWLFTIAHRKVIDHVRARTRRPVPAGVMPEPTADPVRFGALDPVWDGVARLPEKQRAAIALRFLGDLAHAEIAQAMGTSEAAARRSVHEGIRRLREEHGHE